MYTCNIGGEEEENDDDGDYDVGDNDNDDGGDNDNGDDNHDDVGDEMMPMNNAGIHHRLSSCMTPLPPLSLLLLTFTQRHQHTPSTVQQH